MKSSAFLSRRHFLALSLAGAAGAALRCPAAPDVAFDIESEPFTLGVASGDPLEDRVIIWTRLAPEPVNVGGGMPDGPATVVWEVASDPDFDQVVRSGLAVAHPSLAHSVHVDVPRLEPDSWYWYRFTAGLYQSPVGRTRTLPPRDSSPDELRFAVASCQNYKDGYYTAHAGLAQEDLDLVLFVGDYIYESGADGNPPIPDRNHNGSRLRSLGSYRKRYGLYKSDPDLQAAHAAFPWIVTWDDHEVENNYAGFVQDVEKPPTDMATLRANAYLAYYEHMPIRVLPPKGPDLVIHRSFEYGDLAKFYVADTRQFRSDQRCNDQIGPACPEVGDPGDTLLGDAQEAWLQQEMLASRGLWNVLTQQVVFTPTVFADVFLNPDQWDGYPVARQRINDFVTANDVRNFVVLSGDIHASGAAYISETASDPATPVIGAEFVAQGISSAFDPQLANIVEPLALQLPHVRAFDARKRGYLRCSVRRDQWVTDIRGVETALEPVSTVSTITTLAMEPGNLDPQVVS
ncbi:MAG: alkaline phosphatase D family protein [Myxococcota bacterium]